MKKVLPLFLTLCLLAATCPIAIAGETTDFSGYSDEELLVLLTDVQSEMVARKIEKILYSTRTASKRIWCLPASRRAIC